MLKAMFIVGSMLVASVAVQAQVAETVTAPAVSAPPLTPAAAEAERKASEARIKEQEKIAEQERAASEKRMKEQEKQAEKERKAAEKQAEAERKAAEKAAAEAAAAEKLAAEKAAAEKAAAEQAAAARTAAAAPAVAAVPLAKDSRDRVVQVCTAEAKRRGAAIGAADVSLEDVKDTDVKSGGFASMEAKMNLVTKDSKGRIKTSKKTVTCETKNDVVTKFKVK